MTLKPVGSYLSRCKCDWRASTYVTARKGTIYDRQETQCPETRCKYKGGHALERAIRRLRGAPCRALAGILPSGSTEEYLVRTLLDLRWRKRRLECYEQFTMQKRLDEIREKREVKRYIEKLCSFADEFEEAKKKEIVETLLDHLEPEYSCFIQTKWPLQAGEDESNWGARIAEGILALKPPAIPEKAMSSWRSVTPKHLTHRSNASRGWTP